MKLSPNYICIVCIFLIFKILNVISSVALFHFFDIEWKFFYGWEVLFALILYFLSRAIDFNKTDSIVTIKNRWPFNSVLSAIQVGSGGVEVIGGLYYGIIVFRGRSGSRNNFEIIPCAFYSSNELKILIELVGRVEREGRSIDS